MGRAWGYWTTGKLDVLRAYLDAFTTASSSSQERIYIDAFAGEVENSDRLTGEQIEGSARVALSIDSPPFTRLRFLRDAGPTLPNLRAPSEPSSPAVTSG